MSCIFGSASQWATIRLIAPGIFERIARYEERFGRTIQRARSIRELAALGRPYQAAIENPDLVALALSRSWSLPIVGSPGQWRTPAGAFAERSGPSWAAARQGRRRPDPTPTALCVSSYPSPVISLPTGESVLLEPREITFLDLALVAVDETGQEGPPIAFKKARLH